MRLTLRIANVTNHDLTLVAQALWADGIGRVLTQDTDAMYQPSLPDVEYMVSQWIDGDGNLTIDCDGPDDLDCPSDEQPYCPHVDVAVKAIGDRVAAYGVRPGLVTETPTLA